ncbi:hypothetical protein NPIL_237961 [Nephila pilipes]|uniref:Uncharacterized protein n=1 Tax=Nephila pilipes TaxID=299642 RepID=A0A8X6IAJ5_NEPPI|nr:hypothetical protein NPIL_237961 [Nephila pilipes]
MHLRRVAAAAVVECSCCWYATRCICQPACSGVLFCFCAAMFSVFFAGSAKKGGNAALANAGFAILRASWRRQPLLFAARSQWRWPWCRFCSCATRVELVAYGG